MKVYINGRFLTQPMSGVQRFAREILGALDDVLSASPTRSPAIEVLVPHAVDPPNWQALRLRVVRGGAGHLWEQTTLAFAARHGVLVSLGNAGPLVHNNHVLCLHDAHLYDIPEAFSVRYRIWHQLMRPILASRARRLITVSDHSARRLGLHLGVSPTRFEVIANGADHVRSWPNGVDVMARYGLASGSYLLSVGNQSPNKNLDRLIAAHAGAGPDVPPLVLVGADAPGVARGPVRQGRIRCLGRVPDADLRGLYQGAAGFVFASLHEGFGIPPLEAMHLGVPVVCSRAGAMPDVLGDAPIWFDPTDTDDMSAALRRFADLTAHARAAQIARGRKIAARYTWEASAGALHRILNKAAYSTDIVGLQRLRT